MRSDRARARCDRGAGAVRATRWHNVFGGGSSRRSSRRGWPRAPNDRRRLRRAAGAWSGVRRDVWVSGGRGEGGHFPAPEFWDPQRWHTPSSIHHGVVKCENGKEALARSQLTTRGNIPLVDGDLVIAGPSGWAMRAPGSRILRRCFCMPSGGYKRHYARPWLDLVDLSRIPSGLFIREVHPGSEMASQNDQNKAKIKAQPVENFAWLPVGVIPNKTGRGSVSLI